MTHQSSLFHQLPPHIEPIFRPLCTAVPSAQLPKLRFQIETYLDNIRTAMAHNEFLDIDTAVSLATTLTTLLDEYGRFPAALQALIVGAVLYFLEGDDAEHDTHSLLGLDDDVLVLNFVLDQCNLSQRKIRL